MIWAVVGPTVGLLVGLLIGYLAWSGKEAAAPPKREKSSAPRSPQAARRPEPEPKPKPEPEPRPKPPVTVAGRAGEKEWLRKRGLPAPELAYLFSGKGTRTPLGGSLAAEAHRLKASGPVTVTAAGAVFRDGGKLLSLEAGRALAARIKAARAFSVEALVRPADTRHRGPARIVSLSYDGLKRNFTLGQEGASWSIRLRTSRTGANGTNPQVSVSGLTTKMTHVVVTFDGKVERIYLDGRQVQQSTAVAGDLDGWDAKRFPLVLGNEAREPRNWAGTIKFAAVYARVLSADHIRKAHNNLPPGSAPTSPGARDGPDVF